MQIPFYFAGQFRKYIFAFADLFSGVRIARFNPDGTIHHTEVVPLLFPDQDKYFAYYTQQYTGGSSVNPDLKIELGKSLPNFTVGDIGFGIDQARMRNKYDLLCESAKHAFVATPYQIKMNLRLNFEKLEECFQVIEQLFPLFNTQLSVNVNPIDQDFANNLSCPVVLESQSNIFPSDLPEDDERLYQFTMSFRMDVWLFGRVIDNSATSATINFTQDTK